MICWALKVGIRYCFNAVVVLQFNDEALKSTNLEKLEVTLRDGFVLRIKIVYLKKRVNISDFVLLD